MPSKSLRKVQKRIVKKKGSRAPALHENSRDSQRLRRATGRHDKLALLTATRLKLTQPFLHRVAFFQDKAANNHQPTFPPAAIHSLIQEYIARNDAELLSLQTARRPGRPTTPHHDALSQLHVRDLQEYTSGFWLPDLADPAAVQSLLRWDGADWQALNTVPFCRVARDGGKRAAAFPPNHDA